jgi:hypothetical protein
MKHIVFTRHDGGVSVCTPTREVLGQMLNGGFWADKPRWFVDEQVHRQVKAGIREDHAARFAKAIYYGGVSEREAYEIIRDRDTARLGTLHELHDTQDLPPDRWFRDAWRRSHNGGPIGIALEPARLAHWERLTDAVEIANKRRTLALRALPPIEIEPLRAPVEHARDIDELRRIWPEALPSQTTPRP